jgi:hypothetical protein
MANRVLVVDGDDLGHFFLSIEGRTLKIGDHPSHPEVVLRELHIANIRCEIEVEDEAVVVQDATSMIGMASGKGGLRQELHSGGVFHAGHLHLRFDPGSAREETTSLLSAEDLLRSDSAGAGIEAPGADAATSVPTERAQIQLRVTDGADLGRCFYLPESGTVLLGSSSKNADLVLHDLYVSRVHCEVEVKEDRILISHVEGQNGTLVNGQRIGEPVELQQGDEIRIGNSHLRLELAGREASARSEESAAGASQGAGGPGSPEQAEDVEVGEPIPDEEALEVAEDVTDVVSGEGDAASETGTPASAQEGRWSQAGSPMAQLLKLAGQDLGHYQIGPLLGRGFTGMVFHAQDLKNQQRVALKVLATTFPASSEELQRFVQALRRTTLLPHPNLVTLYGVGKTGPFCWIAREYIEGESVAELIRDLGARTLFDWTRACRVGVHLARALSFVHQNKIVHGNLVPRNILIRESDQQTKLADLMLAKALEGSQLQEAVFEKKWLTELPFLAPEQTVADAPEDHRIDLYALGAVLYALLTGQPPYRSETPERLLAMVREGKVVRPTRHQPRIPAAFEAVVLKLLSRNPDERYRSANDLLTELEAIAKVHLIEVGSGSLVSDAAGRKL